MAKIKIMLDAGHAGKYYNASPVVNGYYESQTMWNLSHKLKTALEAYGFEVGMTRSNINDDPELTERGRRARGYDLFLSLHSNAAASESPDAPWMIHLRSDNKTDIDEESVRVAQVLGETISETMGVSAPYYYTKPIDSDRDGNGHLDDEWYGVLHGAKSVGVPAVIAEHSFHTNKKAAQWLLSESNLDKLAKGEAASLAAYYGMEDEGMTADERKEFELLKKLVNEQVEEIDVLKAQVGIKWAYIDKNLPEWATPTIKKLVAKGLLKGNNNSLELSYQMLRTFVILDRAGLFD